MIFTIEPMINAGRREIREMPDGWTIVTKDRSLSAQWEHTVLVTDDRLRGAHRLGRQPAAARRAGRRPRSLPARRPEPRHGRQRPAAGAGGRRRLDGAAAHALPQRQGGAARRLPQCPSSVTTAAGLLRGLTRHVDRTLAAVWTQAALPPARRCVAVGGYGRGELFPYSDVDVLVLLPDSATGATHETVAAAVAGFISRCWDIGLEISSSVRTRRGMRRRQPARHHAADGAARIAPAVRQPAAVRRLSRRHLARARCACLPACQDARDAAAPPQVRGHALLARTELQGEPRRPARPADRAVGRPRRRLRQQLEGARRARA